MEKQNFASAVGKQKYRINLLLFWRNKKKWKELMRYEHVDVVVTDRI